MPSPFIEKAKRSFGHRVDAHDARAVYSSALAHLAEQQTAIEADFESTARSGEVPGAALYSMLCDNALSVLAEQQCLRDHLEEEQRARLARLNALYPPAAPPEPEKPTPLRTRHFVPVKDIWGQPPTEARH